jgi:hypothetical protein
VPWPATGWLLRIALRVARRDDHREVSVAISSLRRRLARLETATGSVGSFEKRIRRLAVGMEVNPERLLAVTKGHEADLSLSIDYDGLITWGAFCQIYDLLAEEGR